MRVYENGASQKLPRVRPFWLRVLRLPLVWWRFYKIPQRPGGNSTRWRRAVLAWKLAVLTLRRAG